MTLYIFTNAFRDACIRASIYAVSFICVLLLITLRKPGLTVLAGLTTKVGFGSLFISSHQGIYSLGMLAFVGSLCTLAAAVLFLPALLQVISWQRGAVRQRSPRDP